MISQPLARQIFRFGVVGVAATVTHVAVAVTLIERVGTPVLAGNGLAFLVAVFVSYFGHHSWTFARDGFHDRHLPRFVTISLIGLALNQAIIFALVTLGGLPYLVGVLVVVSVVPALTFVLSRSWAFVEFRSRAEPGSGTRP
jgi:putative flippase GtrA